MSETAAIRTVPMVYRGTQFRSTLEADWAATFDHLSWYWEYEPQAYQLDDGSYYRPDFYLPSQRVWCEVKGPHDKRLHKPRQLQQSVDYDPWEWSSDLVVVLRPAGPGETAMWEGTTDAEDIVVVRCPQCQHYGFMDYAGWWMCRRHMSKGKENKFWYGEGGGFYYSGSLPFVRAPRPNRK